MEFWKAFEDIPEGLLCGMHCKECNIQTTHKKRENQWVCINCELIKSIKRPNRLIESR